MHILSTRYSVGFQSKRLLRSDGLCMFHLPESALIRDRDTFENRGPQQLCINFPSRLAASISIQSRSKGQKPATYYSCRTSIHCLPRVSFGFIGRLDMQKSHGTELLGEADSCRNYRDILQLELWQSRRVFGAGRSPFRIADHWLSKVHLTVSY